MKPKMSIWGIGGVLFTVVISYSVVVILLGSYFSGKFNFPAIPLYRVCLGIFLTGIGYLFLFITMRTFSHKFRNGELATTGTFAWCRNPIYAAWIFFIIPGIALWINSWLMLGASVLMYILFKFTIKKEEEALFKTFGEKYLVYKNSVNELFPFPNYIGSKNGR